MAKRKIKNNFKKWLAKGLPFFMIVFFVFFNISFFVFNASSYAKKINDPLGIGLMKFSNESTFDFVLSSHEKENLKETLEIYKMEKDEYPAKIEDVVGQVKNKNWMYTKSGDRYILEYK